jgi:branched-chain amino acid transport system ATP-binding protein
MLVLGRALMSRCKLLLLDEPSMGLAPILVEEVFATIVGVREMGTPVLLVEQNANMALAIADRGYVLETGRIVLEGEASVLASMDEIRAAYLGE